MHYGFRTSAAVTPCIAVERVRARQQYHSWLFIEGCGGQTWQTPARSYGRDAKS